MLRVEGGDFDDETEVVLLLSPFQRNCTGL